MYLKSKFGLVSLRIILNSLDILHIQTFVLQQSYVTRKVFEITVETGNSERFSQSKIVHYCQVFHYLSNNRYEGNRQTGH